MGLREKIRGPGDSLGPEKGRFLETGGGRGRSARARDFEPYAADRCEAVCVPFKTKAHLRVRQVRDGSWRLESISAAGVFWMLFFNHGARNTSHTRVLRAD